MWWWGYNLLSMGSRCVCVLPQNSLGSWTVFVCVCDMCVQVGVPVITVQLRYDGWVTELQDPTKVNPPPLPSLPHSPCACAPCASSLE